MYFESTHKIRRVNTAITGETNLLNDENVNYSVTDGIARIALARPPVNALNRKLLTGLLGALARASADPEVRVVLLASDVAGRFSAGLDLPHMLKASVDDVRRSPGSLHQSI